LAIYEFEGKVPKIGKGTFVHPEAVIIGDVEIGDNCYIGATAVLRADTGKIKIGDGTNVQDGAIIHADPGTEAVIGRNNLIGHGAMLHGPLVVGEDVMVGISSVVLTGCEIGDGCIIGAGSVVRNNTKLAPRRMVAGVPASEVREVSENAVTMTKIGVQIYQERAARSLRGMKKVEL
jgi:carbonic anhydrase/acetyltransferase-like protein (isoleucine patch superfamily)